jgi:hypothetical protein
MRRDDLRRRGDTPVSALHIIYSSDSRKMPFAPVALYPVIGIHESDELPF